MKRNLGLLFSILVMAAIILAACGGGGAATPADSGPGSDSSSGSEPAAEKKVATFIWVQEFTTLSPLYSTGWFTSITRQFWNCWAWQYDENNEPYPYLVTEIPGFENGGISEDGLVITLHLRDDIKWSDGEPITSDDFKFTWEMTIDPKNVVSSTYPYDNVVSIDTPDAQTVVMNFETPFAPWQSL
ncbi:MAG TPA: ABC transporter substrate-binding protein, partial [Anaerolineales bacterium]|nr:ABC transporter substrate-binding protein [Anaerolineales bacterium]